MAKINLFWLLTLAIAIQTHAAPPQKTTPEKRVLMAHYMAWFASKPVSKIWGWHWTMGKFDPEKTTDGKQEAASNFRPVIGLYDSSDPDVLECQTLQMKLAGIDGVILDWYGTDDLYDYAVINRNAEAMMPWLKRAGLKFAICFEDQTVPKLIDAKKIDASDAVKHGQETLRGLEKRWFSDASYLKSDNRPVFFVFGSGYYQSTQWTEIFASLTPSPQFFTEAERRLPAVGAFDWPHPGVENAQNLFYSHAKDWPAFVPAAFPRFDDVYGLAGVQKSYPRIDDDEGKTYVSTLTRALQSSASIVQIVTWNDWGEGTQIEPSARFGYRDLEATLRLRQKFCPSKSTFTPADLRLPAALYKLRKASPPVDKVKLDAISRLLFSGRTADARALLAKFGR